MNHTANNINNALVKQQKVSQAKLRKLTQKSPMLNLLENTGFNSYNEREGVYHIHTLEAGYQRGLFSMINSCAQSKKSVVIYCLDHSDTGVFRIYNTEDNTYRTMHLYGGSVREGVEYLFDIKFTTEALPLKPTKDEDFEERMKQSKTRFESFQSFHDHLIIHDDCTSLELSAAKHDTLKAGLTHIKYVDQIFSFATWVESEQHPQKDGVYKWLWYEDENLIMYTLCQIHNNESSLLHDFYFSYERSLLNSSDYRDFDNEQLLQKLKPFYRKYNLDDILKAI